VIPETLSIQATLIWPAASSTIVGYVELLTALDMALGGALGGGVKSLCVRRSHVRAPGWRTKAARLGKISLHY
jgi:hypothetical protein